MLRARIPNKRRHDWLGRVPWCMTPDLGLQSCLGAGLPSPKSGLSVFSGAGVPDDRLLGGGGMARTQLPASYITPTSGGRLSGSGRRAWLRRLPTRLSSGVRHLGATKARNAKARRTTEVLESRHRDRPDHSLGLPSCPAADQRIPGVALCAARRGLPRVAGFAMDLTRSRAPRGKSLATSSSSVSGT